MLINVHSYYSLRYGTLAIEKLIELALLYNVNTLALTDINNTSASVEFVFRCIKAGIKPVAGVEVRNENKLLYILLAQNNEGFCFINDFLSEYLLSNLPFPERAPEIPWIYCIYPYPALDYSDLGFNQFLGVYPDQLSGIEIINNVHLRKKCVALHPVTFSTRSEYMLHCHLRAIDKNTLLEKLQAVDLASDNEMFVSENSVKNFYGNFPEIVSNTQYLLNSCQISFVSHLSKNRQTYTGDKIKDRELLNKLAFTGYKFRYGVNTEAQKRLLSELDTIENLGFSAYYLITWDIVSYSMSKGIYHVGRGSGANSIVAYCLKITDVDPIELDLYFERFLNPKRKSPPDFDIDYSWRDRDTIHDYIFERFGKKNTALLGAMVTFQGKSIIRELAKVYGLSKYDTDMLVDNPYDMRYRNSVTDNILEIGQLMEDFPNIRSIHAGGVLISELPITNYSALDMPPKGYQTTQYDMYAAEEMGFEKLDILSQRGIGHIFDACNLIKKNRGIDIDIHNVAMFKTDPNVIEQLKKGETIGCFYIESPAMRGLLRKLRCDNYLSLVAASSIIRPGVAKSGMMREYIKRFHNPEGVVYLHPEFKKQLSETFGVMVYQEDVLKICHHFAGLDLADADVLRRLMSGKARNKDEFNAIVTKFFTNCKQKGYPDDLVVEVWRQISSFAGYSFSKAHSASYAVESFQSLYLKTHYPLEFMVAVINNFGGFYNTRVYFNEAKRWGAVIELPCVNNSVNTTSIVQSTVYIGFIHVLNLESKIVDNICSERKLKGPYLDLMNFLMRVPIGIEQLKILIRMGAFRFTQQSKAALLWQAFSFLKKNKLPSSSNVLFAPEVKTHTLPNLAQTPEEDAYDEIEFLGFPVTVSMFDMLVTKFRGEVFANDMIMSVGKDIRMLGNLVSIKYIKMSSGKIMNFGTFIDFQGNFFDTVHFPGSLLNYPFKGDGIYLLKGVITQEFGHPQLEVAKMAKLPLKPDTRFT